MQPSAACTAAMLKDRLVAMLLGGKDAHPLPQARKQDAVAHILTYAHIVAANEAARALWASSEAEIKQRCAPLMPM